MEELYKCIDSFSVQKVDADGFEIENQQMIIEKNSIWELIENSSDIELIRVDKGITGYQEITIDKETLISCFENYKE